MNCFLYASVRWDMLMAGLTSGVGVFGICYVWVWGTNVGLAS
jgi:hypothetical protein